MRSDDKHNHKKENALKEDSWHHAICRYHEKKMRKVEFTSRERLHILFMRYAIQNLKYICHLNVLHLIMAFLF